MNKISALATIVVSLGVSLSVYAERGDPRGDKSIEQNYSPRPVVPEDRLDRGYPTVSGDPRFDRSHREFLFAPAPTLLEVAGTYTPSTLVTLSGDEMPFPPQYSPTLQIGPTETIATQETPEETISRVYKTTWTIRGIALIPPDDDLDRAVLLCKPRRDAMLVCEEVVHDSIGSFVRRIFYFHNSAPERRRSTLESAFSAMSIK